MPTASERRLISAAEAARYLNLHRATVYDLVAKGLLPSLKIGARRLFDLRELDRYIDERTQRERHAAAILAAKVLGGDPQLLQGGKGRRARRSLKAPGQGRDPERP